MNWDPIRHIENRNKVPTERLLLFQGKHVAWNLEGTEIVAAGDDDELVFEELQRLGIPTEEAVLSYVPNKDEDSMIFTLILADEGESPE